MMSQIEPPSLIQPRTQPLLYCDVYISNNFYIDGTTHLRLAQDSIILNSGIQCLAAPHGMQFVVPLISTVMKLTENLGSEC